MSARVWVAVAAMALAGRGVFAVPRRKLQTSATVSTTVQLEAAIANSAVSLIQVEVAGSPYLLTGPLVIDRAVIISSNGLAVLDAGGSFRVVEITATGNVVMIGLELTGGAGNPANVHEAGGAVRVVAGGSLDLQFCTVSNSRCNHDSGGGIANFGGTLTLNNSIGMTTAPNVRALVCGREGALAYGRLRARQLRSDFLLTSPVHVACSDGQHRSCRPWRRHLQQT